MSSYAYGNEHTLRTRPSPFKPPHHRSHSIMADVHGIGAGLTPAQLHHQLSPRTPRRTPAGARAAPSSHASSYYAAASASVATAASSTPAAPSSSVLNAFSSFLLSSAYHSSEAELRAEGAVDLSRRSGGGLDRQRSQQKARLKRAATAQAHANALTEVGAGGGGSLGLGVSGLQLPVPPPRFDGADLEDEEQEKGDFAIIVRLESKLFRRTTLPLNNHTTQPPSSEHSRCRPAAPTVPTATTSADQALADAPSPPDSASADCASTPPRLTVRTESVSGEEAATAAAADASATVAAAVGAGLPPPPPPPVPSSSLPGSSGPRRVSLMTNTTLRESRRLRTLCARLNRAGLRFVKEKQIVNGRVLLRVYANSDTLEQAAFRLRLKMPLKPQSNLGAHGMDASAPAPSTRGSASSSAPSFYTFVPFDPSIRDQFLGTQDPACLFRSSERQILIDFILRTSVGEGGAGLGNQHANEVEYARKLKAKAKERRDMRRNARKGKSSAAAAAATAAAARNRRQRGADDGEHKESTPDFVDSSDSDWSSSDEECASGSSSISPGVGGGGSSEVRNIEQYIVARFPLHSSRLEALDSWLSYWQLRKKLGSFTWFTGLFVQPMDAISSYFGNEVGFFYAFMNFYIRGLVAPAIVGFVLFLTQLSLSAIDSPFLPLFSLFFALWSSVLIEVWKRRESSLSWKWGSFEYESEEEKTRPEFEGVARRDPVSGGVEKYYPFARRLAKVLTSTVAWTGLLLGVGWGMVEIFNYWDNVVNQVKELQIGRGYFSLDLIFVPCMWGVLIPLLDSLFGKAALRLTNWENWRLSSTFHAAHTAKVFSFRFTNAFLVLYYYIFSDQGSMVRLTTSVASFMMVGQLARFVLGVGVPYARKKFSGWRARKKAKQARMQLHASTPTAAMRAMQAAQDASAGSVPPPAPALPLSNSDGSAVDPTATALDAAGEEVQLSQAWLESTYPEYDHFEEYANTAIQFGYVCFFSVVFPFAPLCALLYNLLMVRVGAFKLCRLTRRPLARKSSGLGIWLHVLQLMSLIAVLTNCALIAITSTQLRSLFPQVTETTKILVIFGFEHVVILLKIAIALAIPDVTKEVRLHRRKEKLALTQANTQLMDIRRKEIVQRAHQAGDMASIDQLYAVTI